MPDISMCENINCKKRKSCYRYLAKPDEYWQSYALFNSEGTQSCQHYWRINIKKETRPLCSLEEADAKVKRIFEFKKGEESIVDSDS